MICFAYLYCLFGPNKDEYYNIIIVINKSMNIIIVISHDFSISYIYNIHDLNVNVVNINI